MAPRKKKAEEAEPEVEVPAEVVEEAKPEAKSGRGYRVLDGNGKLFSVVKDEEEARTLADKIQGRIEQ